MEVDPKKQLNRYLNQIGSLKEELVHHENERSVDQWKIKELEHQVGTLGKLRQNLEQDLVLEREKYLALEESHKHLRLQMDKSERLADDLNRKLRQLRSEARVISHKIQQSYAELSTRRKISESLDGVPFNNSDDEHDGDGDEDEMDLSIAPNAKTVDDADFEEWDDGSESSLSASQSDEEEYIAMYQDTNVDAPPHAPSPLQETLLNQYQTLIDNLQAENVKLLQQNQTILQRLAARHHKKRPAAFVAAGCPSSLLKPKHALIWQYWLADALAPHTRPFSAEPVRSTVVD